MWYNLKFRLSKELGWGFETVILSLIIIILFLHFKIF